MTKRILATLFLLTLKWWLSACGPAIATPAFQSTASAKETRLDTSLPPATTVLTLEPQVEPVGTVSVEDNQLSLEIPFTPERPLSDPDEIVKILERLKQKYIEWLSRPGWYVYRMPWEDGEYRLWGTHFTNDQGDCCEQFHFLEKEGEIYPVEIRLADGTWGTLYGKKGRLDMAAATPPEQSGRCQIEDVQFDVVWRAHGVQRRLEDTNSGMIEAYKLLLWQEVIDGREVVVLYEDIEKSKGVFRLADGTFAPVAREIEWTYLDPETGGRVGGDGALYGENGEILGGEEKGKREVKLSDLLFYDELPPEILQTYEEAAEALRDYIQRSNSQ